MAIPKCSQLEESDFSHVVFGRESAPITWRCEWKMSEEGSPIAGNCGLALCRFEGVEPACVGAYADLI